MAINNFILKLLKKLKTVKLLKAFSLCKNIFFGPVFKRCF